MIDIFCLYFGLHNLKFKFFREKKINGVIICHEKKEHILTGG